MSNLRAMTQAASGRLDQAAETLRLAEADTARLALLQGGGVTASHLPGPVTLAAATEDEREGDVTIGTFVVEVVVEEVVFGV